MSESLKKIGKRLLFVGPEINPPGGAQCVAAWALQGLRSEYDVDLLTWTRVDFDEINRFYGTTLDAREFKNIYAPFWLSRLVDLDPDQYSFQRIAILLRIAKIIRAKYDLLISLCDEVDLGEPAIQYIHFPWLSRIYRQEKALENIPGWLGRLRAGCHKHRPWRIISGFSFERMKRNLTIVNSNWTAQFVRGEFGIEPITLYPPVPGDFPHIPWAERENGFVCIGRISGEKKYREIISILSHVRARCHAIHLHIVGEKSGQRDANIYYQHIMELVRANSDWVSFEENISRDELTQLIARHRYGIHGMPDEHFGIAVAEMVRGGCIVFAPNSGGQVEILGGDPRLLYTSDGHAVDLISRVLGDPAAQRDLQSALEVRGNLFSVERFTQDLREIVSRWFTEKQVMNPDVA